MGYKYDWVGRWNELVESAQKNEEIQNSINDLRSIIGKPEYSPFTTQDFALNTSLTSEVEELINKLQEQDLLLAQDRERENLSRLNYFKRAFRIFPSSWKEELGLLLGILSMAIFNYTSKPNEVDVWIIYVAAALASFRLILLMRKSLMITQERIEGLDHIIKLLSHNIDKKIVEQKILPLMRQHINNEIARLNKDKSTVFKIKDAPGIWRSIEPHQEIETSASKKVIWLLQKIKSSSGSIGIAGPRGIGKTTLLNSLCRSQIGGEQKLLIYMPVPVKYDAHEFILHLFRRVCEEFLKLEQETEQELNPVSEKLLLNKLQDYINVFSPTLIYLATIGFLGMLLGVILKVDPKKIESALSFLAQFTIIQSIIQNFLNLKTWLTDVMEISPKDLFSLGFLVFLIPTVLLLPATAKTIKEWITSTLEYFFKVITKTIGRKKRKDSFQNPLNYKKKNINLISKAKFHLQAIKYELSFSYGWSESVNPPDSIRLFEVSTQNSVSKTRNKLTLPELIEQYRNFLGEISSSYPVLIAIDEMDKISSITDAQKFLNEIKAIFNIDRCVYLVSISDNALSNFDRRGLALRDEFDTSFDFVLSLEMPDLAYATKLIWQRVIGMPISFIYLAYVLSGGIPRDVIRTCREMMYIANAFGGDISISEMCKELVLQNLKAKAHAVLITATAQEGSSGSDILLEAINQIENINQSKRDLPIWLLSQYEIITAKTSAHRIQIRPVIPTEIILLQNELAAYLYFYSTILTYFYKIDARKQMDALKQDDKDYPDVLATVQRSISLNAEYANLLISRFRKDIGLPKVKAK